MFMMDQAYLKLQIVQAFLDGDWNPKTKVLAV
jgi:hypothetical protein